jgi:hypothetical protein
VFTARYALSPYIKQIRFVFKGLKIAMRLRRKTEAYVEVNFYYRTSRLRILPAESVQGKWQPSAVLSALSKKV